MNPRRIIIVTPTPPRPYLTTMLAWQLFGGLLLLVDAATPWVYSFGLAEGTVMTGVVGLVSTLGSTAALLGLLAPFGRTDRRWAVEASGHMALAGSTTAYAISAYGSSPSSVIEWSCALALAVSSIARAAQLIRHPAEAYHALAPQ